MTSKASLYLKRKIYTETLVNTVTLRSCVKRISKSDPQQTWHLSSEGYVALLSRHSESKFLHSLLPDCCNMPHRNNKKRCKTVYIHLEQSAPTHCRKTVWDSNAAELFKNSRIKVWLHSSIPVSSIQPLLPAAATPPSGAKANQDRDHSPSDTQQIRRMLSTISNTLDTQGWTKAGYRVKCRGSYFI